MIAYHFSSEKLRDGRPLPAIGEWLVHDGKCVICKSGLHASIHPMDALQYAPGPLLHLVECEDIAVEESDKFVCRRRKIIKSIDTTDLLRSFSRWSALQVIHLWDAPDVVRRFLETGDESLRDAARAAARDAAKAAAWDAAKAAAWGAAWTAAWDAAWTAAWTAAWAAARDAVWGAASAAARAAARGAVWDAQKAEFKLRVDEAFAWAPSSHSASACGSRS